DSMVFGRLRLFKEWLALLPRLTEDRRQALEIAWKKAWTALQTANSKWSRVKGTLTATVAALQDLGWELVAWACGPVNHWKQTVPIAGLAAATDAVRMTEGPRVLAVDAQSVVSGISRPVMTAMPDPEALALKSHVGASHNKVMAATAAVQANVAALSTAMSNHAENVDRQVEARMRRAETQLTEHEEHISSLGNQITYLSEQMCCIKSEEPVALGALRNRDGSWKKFQAKTPMGQVVDLSASADRNQFQVRRELGRKLIRREFEQTYPDTRFFVDRERGDISLAWKRLPRYTPASDGPPTIEWNIANVEALQLCKTTQLEPRVLALFQTPTDGGARFLQRVFEALVGVQLRQCFAQFSWNANALCHRYPPTRSQRFNYLAPLVSPTSVAAVQETRGAEEKARNLVHFVHKPHECHACFKMSPAPSLEEDGVWIPDPCAAGAITLIPRASNPEIVLETFPEFQDPGTGCQTRRGAQDAARRKCFSSLVGIQQQDPTRIYAPNATMSIIDRAFTSLPAWVVLQLNICGHTCGLTEVVYSKKLSCHAAIRMDFRVAPKKDPDTRGIQEVLKRLWLTEQSHFEKLKRLAQNISKLSGELDLPALVAIDFAQAFPSVSHRWTRLMLKAIRLPDALVDFRMLLCKGVSCFSEFGGVLRFMFPIMSGIVQGCPASGTIFAVCMDPFACDFDRSIESKARGIVRRCAGDVGAAILKLQFMAQLFRIFSAAEQIAALVLKTCNCNGLMLAGPYSEALANKYKQRLSSVVPSWSEFKIVSLLKYLGMFLGPE
ncbi:unnamed protein product, partial [Prorocentrum cordatum]